MHMHGEQNRRHFQTQPADLGHESALNIIHASQNLRIRSRLYIVIAQDIPAV